MTTHELVFATSHGKRQSTNNPNNHAANKREPMAIVRKAILECLTLMARHKPWRQVMKQQKVVY